jgi:hypothetical protein
MSILWPKRRGGAAVMDDTSFISGVWCGVIFGAAGMLLIISLIVEIAHRKHERQLRRVRQIWQ